MTNNSEIYNKKQYDLLADAFRSAQEEFYSKKINESRKVLYSILDGHLKNKKVLDVGCGFGKDILYYQLKGAKVFGVDISKKMIEMARKNIKAADLSVQDYSKLNFKSGYFDVVVSRYALQYNRNMEKTFKEVHRVLRPGGLFVFLVSHPILGYTAKREKDYHKQEVVDLPIFNGKIKIKEPTHTLSEYLSDYMLENFILLSQKESRVSENKFPGQNIPDFIALKFKKIT